MDKQDRIIAALAIGALVVFMGVMVGFVREPDLAIIVIGGLGLAAYDFWRTHKQGKKSKTKAKTE